MKATRKKQAADEEARKREEAESEKNRRCETKNIVFEKEAERNWDDFSIEMSQQTSHSSLQYCYPY